MRPILWYGLGALLLTACWSPVEERPTLATDTPAHPTQRATSTGTLPVAETPLATRPSLPTQTATAAPATATPSATSLPGPATLLEPADGAALPQPMAPVEWLFRWDGRRGPCHGLISIDGPGERQIMARVDWADGYAYRYSTDEALPNDALEGWTWSVSIVCPQGTSRSAVRSFSVEPVPPATSRPPSPAVPTTTAAGTGVQPQVLTFTAQPAEVDPGERVTLVWTSSGATEATVWRMLPTGQFGWFWEVPPNGSVEVEIEATARNSRMFLLYVSNGSLTSVPSAVTVTIRCPDEYYFSPAPEGCPGEPPTFSPAAEQLFERGRMIWLQGLAAIFVLYADDATPAWERHADTWREGDPDSDPSLVPPTGLVQPIRGFGRVWRTAYGVRDRLGWALGNELPFAGAYQRDSAPKYSSFWLRASDGRVIHLQPERSRWAFVDS